MPLIESSLRSPSSLPSSDFVYFFHPCQILHDHQTCKPSLSARGLHQSDHHQFYCHQIRTRGPATKVGRGHQRKNVSLYSQICVQQSRLGNGKVAVTRYIQGVRCIQVNFAENIRQLKILGSCPVTVVSRVTAIYRAVINRFDCSRLCHVLVQVDLTLDEIMGRLAHNTKRVTRSRYRKRA